MNHARPIPDIFVDLLKQLAMLVRTEAQLARVETSEKMAQVTAGFGLVLGGAVLVIPALVVLLDAAVSALQERGFAAPLAALIVGGSVLVIGLILVAVGASRLKAKSLVPDKTIQQLQRDASMARNQMRNEDDGVKRAA
jgi:Putative Actinobacterial Holin-X, holin superfamily III